jgi:hypothetical protein
VEPTTLIGKLVGEDALALANRELDFTIRSVVPRDDPEGVRVLAPVSPYHVVTNEVGGFRFRVGHALPHFGSVFFVVSETTRDPMPPQFESAVRVDFPPTAEMRERDVGVVTLHARGSRQLLQGCPDVEVEKHYVRAIGGVPFCVDAAQDVDTCLSEMVARGGKRWEDFLALRYATSRAGTPRVGGMDLTDVPLLTALRRVQKKRDPLVLEIEDGPVFETVFPELPSLSFRIRNVDEDGETIRLETFELGNDGMLGRCRVDLRDADGSPVEPFARPHFVIQGSTWDFALAAGKVVESSLRLQCVLFLPHVGDYTGQLRQHHGARQFVSVRGPLDSWICSNSDPFTIRVLPRPIDLPKSERARLRARFDAIDHQQPVTIVLNRGWRADDEYEGPPATPEDELFRAGWRSVPVLLDVLETPDSPPQVRAWALALLLDITNLFIDENRVGRAAVGRHHEASAWPTVKGSLRDLNDVARRRRIDGPALPDVARQESLIRSWLTIRGSLAIRE